MPRAAKVFCLPEDDVQLNLELFKESDPRDPRIQGEGVCGDLHKAMMDAKLLGLRDETQVHWGENPYARWMDCAVCAARLGTWPKKGNSGKYCTTRRCSTTIAVSRRASSRSL